LRMFASFCAAQTLLPGMFTFCDHLLHGLLARHERLLPDRRSQVATKTSLPQSHEQAWCHALLLLSLPCKPRTVRFPNRMPTTTRSAIERSTFNITPPSIPSRPCRLHSPQRGPS
jgi:hypothetical protein